MISFLFLPLLTGTRMARLVPTVWSWGDALSRSCGSDWTVPRSHHQSLKTDWCMWTSPTGLESFLPCITWTLLENQSLDGLLSKDLEPPLKNGRTLY